MEEYLDLLDSGEKPSFESAPTETKKSGGKKPKVENLFDNKEIKPEPISVDQFNTSGRYFTFMWYVEGAVTPTDDIVAKFLKVAGYLFNKGFIYRAVYDSRSELNKKIEELPGAKVEYYTPWKFKGIDESIPVKKYYPSRLAYGIAHSHHKIFMDLANGLRARLAAEVHSLLGDDCLTPVNFIVSYSAGGDEGLTKTTDYKAIKTMVFGYRIAADSNIAIYNLKNEGVNDKITSKVKSIVGEDTL